MADETKTSGELNDAATPYLDGDYFLWTRGVGVTSTFKALLSGLWTYILGKMSAAGSELSSSGGVPKLNINGLTEDVSPDLSNDFLATFDASANSNKKIRINAAALGKLFLAYPVLSTALTTGTTQPLSLADATFTGKSAGGSTSGNGAAGVVAGIFAGSVGETGAGSTQGGLGSAASATQPYNPTDFPGQNGIRVDLKKRDGDAIVLVDVLSTATGADIDAQVYGYLSYRSDLGANLKWRLWFYYRRASDGAETPITPDTSLTNARLAVPEVKTLANFTITELSGVPQFGQMAAAIGAGAIGTTQLAAQAVTAAKATFAATARFWARITAGAGVAEEITGTQATTMLDAATPSLKGLQSAVDKLKQDNGSANLVASTSIAATVSVSNSVADTTIGTLVIPAGPAAQATFDIEAWGDADNVVTGAQTFSVWVKDNGGTKRITATVTTPASAQTNKGWHFRGKLVVRTTGGGGTAWISGSFESDTSTVKTTLTLPNAASFTHDTTNPQTYTLGMNWGTASVTNVGRAYIAQLNQTK